MNSWGQGNAKCGECGKEFNVTRSTEEEQAQGAGFFIGVKPVEKGGE